jgi:hypothetical protein
MAQYQMQARSSTDGQLYSWISPTRDFAGTGFPGPGAAQHVVVARAVRDDVTGALAGGVDNGDDIKFNTTSHAWERRRGYITVLADPTGVTNAESAIRAALASARSGQCVFLPDGVYLVNHATPIPIPPGVTLVGAERGHNTGPFTVGSTVSLGHMGTQLRIVGTPNLFQVQAQASALHLEVYYPNQNGASAESGHGTFSGTPVEYGWTFDCLGSQNPTIEHITALNPLDFIRISSGTGCSVEDIWAWPLRNGLQLGRIADVARFKKVQFNRTPVLQVYDPALLTWVQANCIGIDNDGAESFQFTDCFAFSLHIGMRFKDLDADGFHDVAGSWKGGGFDSCGICLSVEQPNGLNLAGLGISDATLSSSGTCVQFTDTDPAKGAHIHASNVRFQGVMAHAVLLAAGSYGAYSHVNGSVYSNSGSAFHATDATSSIMLSNVGVPAGVGRRTGGAGRIFDANPWIVR